MKFQYLTLKNLWARLSSESPTFFKKLRGWAISIGACGVALIAAKKEYSEYMSFLNDNIPGYLITFGAACTLVASLAVSDPKDNSAIK